MSPVDDSEGVDFRPFFDMIVGVLFVLLILVGALIFFQQSESQTAAAVQSRLEDLRRHAQADAFLDGVARELASRGIPAQVDHAASTVVLPLSAVVDAAAPDFVPTIKGGALADVGAVVADPVTCVSVPRRPVAACPDVDLLDLVALQVEARIGHMPAGAAVTQGEAARLVGGLVGSALLKGSLPLLRAVNAFGGALVSFGSGLSSANASATSPLVGDLALTFSFRPSAR